MNLSKPKISIILPSYNVKPFIEECIERLKEEIDVLNNTSFDEYLEFKSEHNIEDDILK